MEKNLKINPFEVEPTPTLDSASIPAQVFFNHFEAIFLTIQNNKDFFNIGSSSFFKRFRPYINENRANQIKAMLLNAWNTEFSLRNVVKTADQQYLNHSLHWTFPQAYFSVFYSIRALMATQGVYTSDEKALGKRIANWVARGFYPSYVGFYASGNYNDFKIHRVGSRKARPSLDYVKNQEDASSHVAQFLKTTRTLKAKKLRDEIQSNEDTAIKNKTTGDVLMKFTKKDWEQVTSQMPVTTFFDLLGRLKYSESNREIERFINASISFQDFHDALMGIVYHINLVHETYLVKALGIENYQKFLNELPEHLKNGFVQERYYQSIKPQLLPYNAYHKQQMAA